MYMSNQLSIMENLNQSIRDPSISSSSHCPQQDAGPLGKIFLATATDASHLLPPLLLLRISITQVLIDGSKLTRVFDDTCSELVPVSAIPPSSSSFVSADANPSSSSSCCACCISQQAPGGLLVFKVMLPLNEDQIRVNKALSTVIDHIIIDVEIQSNNIVDGTKACEVKLRGLSAYHPDLKSLGGSFITEHINDKSTWIPYIQSKYKSKPKPSCNCKQLQADKEANNRSKRTRRRHKILQLEEGGMAASAIAAGFLDKLIIDEEEQEGGEGEEASHSEDEDEAEEQHHHDEGRAEAEASAEEDLFSPRAKQVLPKGLSLCYFKMNLWDELYFRPDADPLIDVWPTSDLI